MSLEELHRGDVSNRYGHSHHRAGGVLAGAVALGATNGGGASVPAVQVAGGTPTSVPEGAASTSPGVEASAAPEGAGGEGARLDPAQVRTDCPEKWTYYNDPDGRFSLCYPSDLNGFSHAGASDDLGLVFTVGEPVDPSDPKDSFVLHIAWSVRSSFVTGTPDAISCANDTQTTSAVTKSALVERTVSGRSSNGCNWEGRRGLLANAGQLRMDIPFDRGGKSGSGFVRVTVNYSGPDYMGTLSRAEAVIETIRLP